MNELTNQFSKHKTLAAGVIALLVCGVFGFLRANQIAGLSDLEMELSSKLDKINLNSKHAENIDQDTLKLKELVNSIKARLFIGEERSTNIDFFYSFEEKLNIVISGVQQLDRPNTRFAKNGPDALQIYSTVSYSITLNGTFQEILRFLYEIHQIDSIMRVTDFQIDAPTGKNTDMEQLSAKIHVAVLAQKQ